MRNPARHLRDETGATLPLVALCMLTLLSIAALAVDLGMLRSARAEAQRAADAAALAGASAFMETTPDAEVAETRARDYAVRNAVLNRAVAAGDVWVRVDEAEATVYVQIRREGVPTLFARVFGETARDVGALAAARVTTSGTAACVKPFGLPNTLYQGEEHIGTMKKIWEQKDDGDGLALVGHEGSPPGLGADVRRMLADTECRYTMSTGSFPYRAPDDTRLGQVRNGFNDLIASDPTLTWTPNGPYEGFNREDWASSPRVAVVPLYDPATSNYAPGGTGTLHVTGFLTVFFSHMQRTRPPRPHDQVFGVVLKTVGVSDVCNGGLCSETTPVLQLVK